MSGNSGTGKKVNKLNPAQKQIVVLLLANGLTPSEASKILAAEYGITLTAQGVAKYDPRVVSGANLSMYLRKLFYTKHKQYLAKLEESALAHRRVRIDVLGRLLDRAIADDDRQTIIKTVENARKEMAELMPEPEDDDEQE